MTRRSALPLTTPKPLPTPLAMSAASTHSPLPVRPSSTNPEAAPNKADMGSEYVIDTLIVMSEC